MSSQLTVKVFWNIWRLVNRLPYPGVTPSHVCYTRLTPVAFESLTSDKVQGSFLHRFPSSLRPLLSFPWSQACPTPTPRPCWWSSSRVPSCR